MVRASPFYLACNATSAPNELCNVKIHANMFQVQTYKLNSIIPNQNWNMYTPYHPTLEQFNKCPWGRILKCEVRVWNYWMPEVWNLVYSKLYSGFVSTLNYHAIFGNVNHNLIGARIFILRVCKTTYVKLWNEWGIKYLYSQNDYIE